MDLDKSFSSALTTKSQMSDAEAADVVNSATKENIDDNGNNDSSKD